MRYGIASKWLKTFCGAFSRMKRTCKHCGKHLVLIGTERKNGKPLSTGDGTDWEDRPYHKKCWKEIQREEQFLEQLRLLKERGERRQAMLKQRFELLNGKKESDGVPPPLPDPAGGYAPLRPPIVWTVLPSARHYFLYSFQILASTLRAAPPIITEASLAYAHCSLLTFGRLPAE